jgi:hypothetical protein
VGRRSMQLGLSQSTLEYFYSYGMCATRPRAAARVA